MSKYSILTISLCLIFIQTVSATKEIDCGVPVFKPKLDNKFRILGGSPAVPNSWPWQVYLSIRNIRFGCGASLISDQWLVTAGHCIQNEAMYGAYLGAHIRPSNASVDSYVFINVSKVIRHPDFVRSDENILNDIALIKLSKPVEFSDKIRPVCLPKSYLPRVGKSGIVVGWGTTSNDNVEYANELMQVKVPIREFDYCELDDTSNEEHQICAGDDNVGEEKDACVGDSGGPMVMKHRNKYVLVGVVSFGGQLCGGRGIYTNVLDYVDWIEEQIKENGNDD